MFYVYVLQSLKDGKYYTGSTANLEQRYNDHSSGRTKYTSLHKPFKLVHKEVYNTRSDAVKREKFLKSGKGREILKDLIRE